jgi:Uncharacterized protein conserved in bacteria
MGTATYISPEQAQGIEVDPRSDLYSLGVMIYEMLSGQPPFTGETPVAVAYQHVQDSPASLRSAGVSVAESLEAVTMKLLAKNPVNRYPTAEDLRSDLRRYQEGAHDLRPSNPSGVTGRTVKQPVHVSPQSKKMRVRRDDGFRRTALFTVFMGLLLVVFGYLVVQFLDTIGVEDSDNTPAQLSMSEVPNLIGTPLDEAREILREAKLSVQMDYQTNIDYSENTVFDQEPRAGAKLEQAETVRLWVSKGTGPMTLIKVIGDSVGDAVRDLEAMGLRVDTLELEDPVQPAGQISIRPSTSKKK